MEDVEARQLQLVGVHVVDEIEVDGMRCSTAIHIGLISMPRNEPLGLLGIRTSRSPNGQERDASP